MPSQLQTAEDAQRELAYLDWANKTPIPELAEKHGVSVRTIERWRSEGQWKKRAAVAKLESLSSSREKADAELSDAIPLIMRNAIELSLHAEKDADRISMTKYLLGTLGYSPQASEQWLKAMEARLSQLAEEQKQNGAAAPSKDYSAIFSQAVDVGGIVGAYPAPEPPVNASNGEAEANVEPWDPDGEEVWDDADPR
jgi:hypothetical protein